MDRTARTGKVGQKSDETGSQGRKTKIGQLEKTFGIGKAWEDTYGKEK